MLSGNTIRVSTSLDRKKNVGHGLNPIVCDDVYRQTTLTGKGGLNDCFIGVYPFLIKTLFIRSLFKISLKQTDLILMYLSRMRAVLSCKDPEGRQVVRIPTPGNHKLQKVSLKFSYGSNCYSRYIRTALCETRLLLKGFQDPTPPPPPPPPRLTEFKDQRMIIMVISQDFQTQTIHTVLHLKHNLHNDDFNSIF